MDEDEAALLAELRAISNNSAAAARFQNDEPEPENNIEVMTTPSKDQVMTNDASFVSAKSSASPSNEHFEDAMTGSAIKSTKSPENVPPMESEGKVTENNDEDIVVAAPPSPATVEATETSESTEPESTFGIKSAFSSTFQGDRGGAAEDEELLAELRAISQKSASANRFADDDDDNNKASTDEKVPDPVDSVVETNKNVTESKERPSPKSEPAELPPWKRGKKKAKEPAAFEVDIVVSEPPPAEQQNEPQPLGIKLSVPSTFQGERGGAAEDAELLAELRAISQKSSCTDRFADEGTDEAGTDSRASETVKNTVAAAESEPPTKSPQESLPPWKRSKKAAKPHAAEVDIVVAAPPSPVAEEPAQITESVPQSFGVKTSIPSTFTGDRGGAAEDADLLAELRTISQKSASADRFADDSTEDEGGTSTVDATENVVVTSSTKSAKESASSTKVSPKASNTKSKSPVLPPWKRGKKKAVATEAEVVVAASAPIEQPESSIPETTDDAPPPAFGIKSSLPTTFQGERGGSAEDAELLAELRAISQKSSSADRFADGNDTDNGGEGDTITSEPAIEVTDIAFSSSKSTPRPQPSPKSASETRAKSPLLPPWKRGKKNSAESPAVDADIVVAALPPPAQQAESVDTAPQPMGFKSSLPSTFQGERGGSAEDAELLAELRAISQKSSSADRFASSEDGPGKGDGTSASEPAKSAVAGSSEGYTDEIASRPQQKASKTKKSPLLPPWKRGKKKTLEPADVDVVVSAPRPKSDAQAEANDNAPQSSGIKNSTPSTFQGERGGPAEDAELLAELRAVSSSQPKGGIKSDLPSTFKGDRGGAAEDADLLAELRAISSGASTGANRFSAEPSDAPVGNSKSQVAQRNAAKDANVSALQGRGGGSSSIPTTSASGNVNTGSPPSPAADAGAESSVTKESLPSFVTDKSWKLRKEAYVLLRSLLADRVNNGEGSGNIHGDTLMPGLDDAIPAMVADKNAGALDAALAFAVEYAEHCTGACSSEMATKIATCMIKGGALSSSKPTTSKSASALALKLMEVGDDGYASVHAVSEVLLSEGLSSRKPKVVIASSGLILQAAYDYGAASLPLAIISSSAPKMLSHSNATVRETGLNIVAEICRALGSRAPLQGLIDGMKKAQLSQLDSLLEAQSEATTIRVGLRSTKASNSMQSPGDALAALEAGAKELEAKRYAEREPVNIFLALPKTDYSTRLKLPKWSEKVAALDVVLECGGEKPYKLVQPSSSANYAPLISEMKTLLSHSHFAVASKSMKVLSMLAEGVGSGLYPNLRPLLQQMIMLSKDKKLNKTVGESLDTFFGNVLDIDHLLDNDDALPSVLNEKVQKNALVRASALEYLGRCIKRGESAGPRGRISSKPAAAAACLCCEKLEDSDASVRKAATECLRFLLLVEDEDVPNAISPIIESLKTKNSRAYKSLMGSSGAEKKKGDPNVPATSSRRPQPVPAKSSPSRKAVRPDRTELSSTAKSNAPVRAKPAQTSIKAVRAPESQIDDSADAPNLEEAISVVSSIHIPSWDAPDDDGGVLAGLKCELPPSYAH